MAIVRRLNRVVLERDSKHTEVRDCTYSIIQGDDGRRSLQIDTTALPTERCLTRRANQFDLHLKR